MKIAIAALVSLIAGVIIGFYLPRDAEGSSTDPTHAQTPANHEEEDPKVTDRETEIIDPISEPVATSTDTTVRSEDGPETVVVSTHLISELVSNGATPSYSQNLFSGDGKIEKALEFTDYEKAQVQTAWRVMQQKIRDVETKSMITEEVDDSTMKITVPNITDSARVHSSEFRRKLQESLGENRAEVFLAAKQVDRMFSEDDGDITYTITPESQGDGTWRFRLSMESPTQKKVWVGENIPDDLRHLTDAAGILPAFGEE